MIGLLKTLLSMLRTVMAIFIFFSAFSCAQEYEKEVTKKNDRNMENSTSTFIYNMIPENPQAVITPEYSTAINTFSVKLLEEVYKDESYSSHNVVLSPFSVSRVLSIVTEASTGVSKQELVNSLGGQSALDDATSALSKILYADKSVVLQCADAIWINSSKFTLQPAFKKMANEKYGVEASGLDFTDVQNSADTINGWISSNTNNHITGIINNNNFREKSTLLLTSTIYFEADWTSPFDVSQTRLEPFSTPSGIVQVDMMSSNYQHRIFRTDQYENVKIYYGTDGKDFFYLDVYMPTTVSIDEFIGQICLSALGNQNSSGFGSLSMPKFFFEKEFDLVPMLKNMGVNGIFDENNGEITGMASKKNAQENIFLYIDQIMHKASIKTDEEGTVAYAVTIAAMLATCASTDIILNKPFVYFIRAGENGLVLFAGVVNNPNDKT